MHNAITDVRGVRVGHSHDEILMSGVTVIMFEQPAPASVSVLGGAPGGRDLGCLEPDAAVKSVDAIALSGGSAFGLDAASGVQAWLRERGRGLPVGSAHVPIVPGAICFDLTNGGDKSWDRYPPYRDLGYAAAQAANTDAPMLGTAGAGYGTSTVDLKGGLGSASSRSSNGFTVGAIVAVNALGSAMIGEGPHFWAAPLEQGDEFGGLGYPGVPVSSPLRWKGMSPSQRSPETATTIACVATDAALGKSELKRIATAANAGLSRGLRISHALMDGDTVFAAATGAHPQVPSLADLVEIAALAADCLARAIARGIYHARVPAAHVNAAWSGPPAWCDLFDGTSLRRR